MAGKLTTILTHKEADTYCKQGLNKEALKLYRKLLASAPNIDPSIRKVVENKISQLSKTLESDTPPELGRLSDSDVVLIKQGWGKKGTESEVLVCAQTFFRMGRVREALDELTGLLGSGRATKGVIVLSAQCLAKLHPPSDVAENMEVLGKKIFDAPQKRFLFYVRLVEAMLILKKPGYARPLLDHLQNNPALGKAASQRLMAIADRIAQQYPSKEGGVEDEKDSSSEADPVSRQESVTLQPDQWTQRKQRNQSLLYRLLHPFKRT